MRNAAWALTKSFKSRQNVAKRVRSFAFGIKSSSQSKGTWAVQRNAEVSEVSQQTQLWTARRNKSYVVLWHFVMSYLGKSWARASGARVTHQSTYAIELSNAWQLLLRLSGSVRRWTEDFVSQGAAFPNRSKANTACVWLCTISASLSLCSKAPSLRPLGDPKHFDVGSWCKSQKQHFRLSMMLHFIDKSLVLNMIDVFECSTCFLSHASTFLGCAEEHRYGADMSETGCHSFNLLACFTLAKGLIQVQFILQLNSNCRAPNLAMIKSSPCFFFALDSYSRILLQYRQVI